LNNKMSRLFRRGVSSTQNAVLFGFADYLGYPRWAVRTRFGRHPPTYKSSTSGVGATEYSRIAFAKYQPLARVRWPLFMLASIPGQTEDELLIVGPRFESEFYLARALGWSRRKISGLDLLSYSPFVTVGDMHHMPFPDSKFKSIVCGWTISYSQQPEVAANEMARILRPGGILVFGVEVASNDSESRLDIPKGKLRIQTQSQFESLLPGFECVASFMPEGDGNLIIAMRKPPQ
jgi:SAM-dependent methyltransferase